MGSFSNIITALMNNVPFPINYGILSIITGTVSFMLFPFFGYIINEFEEMEIRVLARIFGMNFALFIADRLTFIGTITHECAHAFFAWLFGAKVGEVKLLTFHHRNELGHVRYFPRGNIIMQHLQMFFTSCAPVIVNTFLTALITQSSHKQLSLKHLLDKDFKSYLPLIMQQLTFSPAYDSLWIQ